MQEADEYTTMPTSGCLSFEKDIGPNNVGVLCERRAIIVIHGANFGRIGRSQVEFHDATGMKTYGTVINSTHTMLQVYLEPGIHKTNIIVYSITYDGNKFDRASLPFEITYDIPRLDNIVFGKSLQTAKISNTFDAQGRYYY